MLAIRQMNLDGLSGRDLLPLAVLGESVERIGARNGISFDRDCDDLDDYRISALELAEMGPERRTTEAVPVVFVGRGPLVFALRAYQHAPRATVDVLLPASLLGSPDLNDLVLDIAAALGIQDDRIVWPAGLRRRTKQDRDERRLVS
jgi:hypothetical protein